MENTCIWIIDLVNPEEYNTSVMLEIFVGRNKFTKAGLFSGPLRRQDISSFLGDSNVNFLLSLDGVAQVGKNRFQLSKYAAFSLLQYFAQNHNDTAYCRLSDKKLHHVSKFSIHSNEEADKQFLVYNNKNGVVSYSLIDFGDVGQDNYTNMITVPIPKLYLNAEGKSIRGFLNFAYGDIEIQANASLERIELSSRTVLRNLRYEKQVQQSLYILGGKRSLRNEIVFSRKQFFTVILPRLCKSEINLYWGEQKQAISKSTISCAISYDMNWFSISGVIAGNSHTYQLSDLLRESHGKAYVEIDNGILFLPDELKRIASYPNKENQIRLSAKHLAEVNRVASKFQIDPSSYLDSFLDFSNCKCNLSPRLESMLKPYQKTGVAWIMNLYNNGFGGCLADEMGLGKTVQAIAFICCQERNSDLPVLIIVPKIVLYNWRSELERFAPEQEVILAYGEFDFDNIEEERIVYLTTYDTLMNRNINFTNINFDAVILDESQYIKNYRTQRYQAVKNINSKFMLAMTGTPIENNIEELWSLLNLLNPGILGSHSSFMREFGNAHDDLKRIELLRKIVSPFLLRRTQSSVLMDLPTKEVSYVYCEMEEPQRILYETLLVAAQNEIEAKPSRYTIKDNATILRALLYLREVCSDPHLLPPDLRSSMPCDSCKFELFKEYANRIMNESGKLIVYSLFPRTLKRIETWCRKQGWNTFYIDGATNNRQRIIDNFERTDQGVFLISLKAGGVGLNLVSCQYVLIYEPWWNYAAEQQAENRVYRIGQIKPVFIYHFLVKNTIEEKMYELQNKKAELSSGMLEGLEQPSQMPMKEILELLF